MPYMTYIRELDDSASSNATNSTNSTNATKKNARAFYVCVRRPAFTRCVKLADVTKVLVQPAHAGQGAVDPE